MNSLVQTRKIYKFLRHLIRQFSEDDCQQAAASLTYQSLFAVVPFLTLLVLVFSEIPLFAGFEERIEGFIFKNIVPENVSHVQEYLRGFLGQAGSLSSASIVLLIVVAFLMLFTIEKTLNHIWKIERPRRGIRRFIMYSAILSISPLAVGTALLVSTYIFSLPLLVDVAETDRILEYLPFLLAALTFTLVFVGVPNCYVSFMHALYGGCLTAMVIELAKSAFVYIMSRSSFELMYGTFAAVPLFLLWLYVTWMIVLLGAEFVKALSVYDERLDSEPRSHLYGLLRVVNAFYQARLKGDIVTEKEMVKGQSRVPRKHWYAYRNYLLSQNLISDFEGGFVLDCDLSMVSFFDLVEKSPWKLPARSEGYCINSRITRIVEDIVQYNYTRLNVDLEFLLQASDSDEPDEPNEPDEPDEPNESKS